MRHLCVLPMQKLSERACTYTNTLTQGYLVIIAFVGIMAEYVDSKLAATVTKIFTYL